jgi:FkbM family methyltransferase
MNRMEVELFSHKFIIPFETHDRKELWLNIESGVWEPQTLRLINHFVTENSVALDVGGSVGETTIFLGFKARKTLAIDPNPFSISCIQEIIDCNLSLFDKIVLFEGALSDRDKLVFFGNGSDYFSDIHFGVNKFDKFVEGISIESLSKRFGLDFSFINIDIEGGEFNCLPAMRDYLKLNSPDLLLSLHPGFNVRSVFLRSNYFFILKLISRIYWNLEIIRSTNSYHFCVDVSRKRSISKWSLLSPRFLSGKNGNECQVLFTNKADLKWE